MRIPLMGLPAYKDWRFFAPGTRVEVRSRFRRDWVRGFEVATTEGLGYRLRRVSDNTVLPVLFARDDLRLPGSGLARRAPAPARFR